MNTDPTQSNINTEALIKRYKDAYTVATVIISFGTALKFLGFLFGFCFIVAGFGLIEQTHEVPSSLQVIYIVGAFIIGIFVWLVFHVFGILSSCQGQVLRASLDEAIYVCPFLTDADRVSAANLPTNRST